MAGESLLVPKDKYERLLEISELYHNMKNQHEENARRLDKSELDNIRPNGENSDDSNMKSDHEENVKRLDKSEPDNNIRTPGVNTVNNVSSQRGNDEFDKGVTHIANDTEQAKALTKRIKYEPVEIDENSSPPGIPLNAVKKRINKLKNDRDKRSRRGSANAKIKRSKEWLAW